MHRFPFVTAFLLVVLLAGPARSAVTPHLLVTTSDWTSGSVASLELSPPWSASTLLEAIGPTATARHALGLHWIVNRSPDDGIQAIDPETWETALTIPLGPGADPHDFLVVSDTKAYVSLHGRSHLLIVNPGTGAVVDSLDLSAFADPDGTPDMSRMERAGDRVFVQLQRLDHSGGGTVPVAPSMLAVIDAVEDTLVDADPALPGTQAIALTGLFPVNDMQVDGEHLYVVEWGSTELADPDGGIDVIDLATLGSLGFLTTEGQLGGDTDCFVLVSPTKGYAVTHTDLLLSSHLTPFSRLDGSRGNEVFASIGARTDQLAYDPLTGYLYFPDQATGDPGIHVIDVATDSVLTASAVSTGLPPRDVLVVRPPAPTDSPGPRAAAAILFAPPRPNPFRLSTAVPFSLARSAPLTLEVFDAAGRRRFVRREEWLAAGTHVVRWNGRERDGRLAPPGVYFVRLSTPAGAAVRRVVRLPE